jgi:uncharacterized protein (DUF58 family)
VNDIQNTEIELRWRASPLAGAIATCAAMALAAAIIADRWQLLAFAAPLVGVLCSISWQRPAPKFVVRAQPDSQRCFESEQVQLTLELTAESDGAAGQLTGSAIAGMKLDVIDDSSRSAQTVAVVAERWGRYPIRATVDVVVRGGLLAGTATVDAAYVNVFPLVPPQSTTLPRTELPDRLGTHLTRHVGRGVEYADIRGYVPGDPLRMVNWPVSARLGSLYVTQRLTDRAADVVVLIDTYPQAAGPASDATERAVRGAAQVIQTALRNGDRAGMIALGGQRPRWLGADIGQRQFYRVIDAFLDIGNDFEMTEGTLAPHTAVPAGAIVIAFSTLLDTEFEFALLDLRKRGHAVLVVDVLEGAPFQDEQDPLIIRMWSLQRAAMYRDMATTGVDVLSWQQDRALEQSMRLMTDRHRPVRGRR